MNVDFRSFTFTQLRRKFYYFAMCGVVIESTLALCR